MNILALDTSHPIGSVAIRRGEDEPLTIRFGSATSHLVELGEAVGSLLDTGGCRISDIDRIALVSGPGSFTGLRIGLSYLKGLYAAVRMDVVTITSLELLATHVAAVHRTVCPMIDARKSEVYTAVYRRDGMRAVAGGEVPRVAVETAPCAATPEGFLASQRVRPMLFVGTGARRFRRLIEEIFGGDAAFADEDEAQPSTGLLCRVGEMLTPLSTEDVLRLEPFYIRASGAKLKPLKRIQP